MKRMKKLLAFILTIVMVVGVLPVSGQTAEAATGDAANRAIKLGKIVWSKDMQTYHFSGVTANFTNDESQKLFCLSVSDGGSFVIADDFRFTGRRTVRGVRKIGDEFEYIGLVRDGNVGEPIAGKELISITVRGENITNAQIKTFIEGLTFKRNGVDPDAVQEVSVVANQVDLDDDKIAMASGGEVHYYQYIKFDDEQKDRNERLTWYDAYNGSKASTYQGMKGYLATITDMSEELYLYGAFKDQVPGNDIQAWVGGARTFTDNIVFDSDNIAKDTLKPKDGNTIARDWYWLCGPEAGKAFYRTNNMGTSQGGEALNGMYNDWNRVSSTEPNNNYTGSVPQDPYSQEYALEYGFREANWNDYSPYNTIRDDYGYGIHGYIIEYSPYTPTTVTGSQGTPIQEDVPSATGFREVRADKAADLDMTVKNFIISTDDAKNLNESSAKTKAEVTVTDQEEEITADKPSITVDSNQLDTVKQGEKGEYDLTYTYANETEPERTISEDATVTVVDKTASGTDGSGAKIEIGANHFSITIEQARAIEKDLSGQTQLIKALANAVATDNGEMVNPQDIKIKSCGIEAKKGDNYPVTFEYKGVEVTVNVSVLDNGSEETTVNLTANDFTVQLHQSTLDKESFIQKSTATATASDGSAVTVTPDPSDFQALNNAIQNGPLGEYEVKITATTNNGASAETVVTVKVVQYPYIDANDFIISVEDAKKATENDVKNAADAKRVENESTPGNSAPIVVPDVSKLNNVKEPGKIPDITLKDTTSGLPSTDKNVTATVVDETAKGKADNGSAQEADIVVGANHFSLTVKQAQEIDNNPTGETAQNIMKTLANAVGTNNGKAVDKKWIMGDGTNIKPINGTYDVSFTYWGQTVTVKATVKDEGAADNSTTADKIPDINLTANDFSIPAKSPVLATTPEDTFKKMADVVAKHNDGSSVTDVTPDAKQLEELAKAVQDGKKGEYPVTVTAKDEDGKTVTATVTVTVTDEGDDSQGADVTNPKRGDEHIGANNFIIGTDDFPLLTPENVLKLSNAEAYETDTKKDVPVTKVDLSKVENKPGTYPITLSTDKGTSTTISVTIDENWKTIGDVDKASDANKKDTSVDQDKAVPASKTPDKPADTKGDDKTFELSNPKDVTQNLDPGREVDNVSLAGTTLPSGDYTVSGSTLTINSSALVNKPEGTYPVVVNYKDGSKRTFNVIVVDKEIVDESHMSGDELNNRDDLPLLLAKGIGGDKKISLSWLKYKGATGYEVYWSYCNGKKVYKKVTSTKKLKATHKKLSYKKSYKYFVIAYKMVGDKKVYIAKSPQIHVAMSKDKRTNAKKVTVKKAKVTLKPGKTSTIKASMTRENNKKKLLQHAKKFRYYTDDYRVATVSNKGKIKAVAAGKCNIYVIANNGVYKKIKVTVKK